MHRLHIYTGDGKGKTTAAMGLALRCAGHDKKVLVTQFLKDGTSGELKALAAVPNVFILPSPAVQGFIFQMDDREKAQTAARLNAFTEEILRVVSEERPDMVILDELNVAVACGMVQESQGRRLVEGALSYAEVVCTGREAPSWLRDRADYLTEMKGLRHPFDTENLEGREGIEW